MTIRKISKIPKATEDNVLSEITPGDFLSLLQYFWLGCFVLCLFVLKTIPGKIYLEEKNIKA